MTTPSTTVGYLRITNPDLVFTQQYQTAAWHTEVRPTPGRYDVAAYDMGGSLSFFAKVPGVVISSFTPTLWGGYGGNIQQEPQNEKHRDVGTERTVSIPLPLSGSSAIQRSDYGPVYLDRDVLYMERRPTTRHTAARDGRPGITEVYEVERLRLGDPKLPECGYIANVGGYSDGSPYTSRQSSLRVVVHPMSFSDW